MPELKINLPEKLLHRLQQEFKNSGLNDFNDFVIALLQQALDSGNRKQSEQEQSEVIKRLKDLGYM